MNVLAAQAYDHLFLRILLTVVAVTIFVGHAFLPKVKMDLTEVCLVLFAVVTTDVVERALVVR
jgi:hypothetical protein